MIYMLSSVPSAPGTPLPLIFLGKSKNALLSTFLFLNQIVWLGRTGIYKDKERVELIGRISLFFSWLGASFCTSLVEIAEIRRLSSSMKKLEKELKNTNNYKNEEYGIKVKKSNERSVALVKAVMHGLGCCGWLATTGTQENYSTRNLCLRICKLSHLLLPGGDDFDYFKGSLKPCLISIKLFDRIHPCVFLILTRCRN